jgi:hypothetical protein
MQKRKAVVLASEFVAQKGYDLSRYEARAAKQGVQWTIQFRRKQADKPSPGDFFTVHIDDESGSVQQLIYGK